MKKSISLFAIFAGIAILLAACGKKDQVQMPEQDTQPFKVAIQEYLKAKNFGMDVSSFDDLAVGQETSSATCKMQEAENLYNVKVTWQFNFEKKDGKWKVRDHTVK